MNAQEFKEKAIRFNDALSGFGLYCHVSHDRNGTWFSFQYRGQVMYIYNSENDGPVYCHNLDLNTRIKESNDFVGGEL